VSGWVRPVVIIGVLALLVVANVVEFRSKRRGDEALTDALDAGSLAERLASRQYQQTRNIEQLLHVVASTLFAILAATLWR